MLSRNFFALFSPFAQATDYHVWKAEVMGPKVAEKTVRRRVSFENVVATDVERMT